MDYNNIFSPQAASDIKEQVASADIPRKLSGKESFERKMAAEMSPQATMFPQAARVGNQGESEDTEDWYLLCAFETYMGRRMATAMPPQVACAGNQRKSEDNKHILEAYIDEFLAAEEKRGASINSSSYPMKK